MSVLIRVILPLQASLWRWLIVFYVLCFSGVSLAKFKVLRMLSGWFFYVFPDGPAELFVLNSLFLFFFNILKPVFLFFWERGCVHKQGCGGAEREGERESKAGCKSCAELDVGLNLTTLRSWSELKSRVRHSTCWATEAPFESTFISFLRFYLFIWQSKW